MKETTTSRPAGPRSALASRVALAMVMVTVEDGWLLGDSTDGTSQLPFVPDETGQRPRHRQAGAGASAPEAESLARQL